MVFTKYRNYCRIYAFGFLLFCCPCLVQGPRERGEALAASVKNEKLNREKNTPALSAIATAEATTAMASAASDGENRANKRLFSLAQCLVYGFAHAPSLRIQRLAYANQLLQTKVAKAGFDPTLSTQSSRQIASESNTHRLSVNKGFVNGVNLSASTQVNDKLGGGSNDSASYSVRLSKTILGDDSLLEVRNGIDDSLVDEAIRLNSISLEKRKLTFDIKRLYYQLIRDKQTLKIQTLRLVRSKRNLEHAIERENPLDIATAKAQIPEDELSILRAQRTIESSLDSLKVRIGMLVSDGLTLADDFDYKIQSVDVDADVSSALKQHESILNVHLEYKKRVWDHKISRRHVMPEVTIGAEIDQSSAGGVNYNGHSERTIDLGVSWPLWDRADRARQARSRNQLREQKINIFSAEQQRSQQIRSLGRRLIESEKSIALQEELVKVGEHRLALFTDRWENGEIDILEYIRSQNDFENSKVRLVNRKTSYMELLAEYLFNVGAVNRRTTSKKK